MDLAQIVVKETIMQAKLVKLGANSFLVLATIGDIQVSIYADKRANDPIGPARLTVRHASCACGALRGVR
jgi:hypothetical protein